MKKLYNSRFIFIVSMSIVFIMVLAFGSVMLTKKSQTTFLDSGYVISSNKVMKFGENTKYRINLNEKIVFSGDNGEIYEVEQDSFIHYKDNSIALLKNGAFVDVKNIDNDIVPYYNITNKSLIKYKDGGYEIKNGDEKLYFDNLLLRVSDNKYLIAGKNVSVKLPGVDGVVKNNYFEITFIENGVVKIENDNDSYQVTAEGTTIYIGENVIDLSTGNVSHKGEVRLNISEVTIDGNENIYIAPDPTTTTTTTTKKSGSGGNNGSGSGSEVEPPVDNEVSVELVELLVSVRGMRAILQVNNPSKIIGNLEANIIETASGEVIVNTKPSVSESGYLEVQTDTLKNNTNYMLVIREVKNNGDFSEYLQRVFTTENYGVDLQKIMISDTDIVYSVNFAENSNINRALFALYDAQGNLIEGTTKEVTKINNVLSYNESDGIKSNTTYTIKAIRLGVDESEKGFISKTVKTLKKKPIYRFEDVPRVKESDEGFILTIPDSSIDDEDGAITNYTFKIYSEANIEEEVYTSPAQPSRVLNLALGANGINNNVNYVYKAIIEYNDNEKIRQIETGFSGKFISSGVTVIFTQYGTTDFDTIRGEIKLVDPDCRVPMPGRTACNGDNTFQLHIEGLENKTINFTATEEDNTFVAKNIEINKLKANTKYTMYLLGNMYVKNEDPTIEGDYILATSTIIGEPFTGQTSEVDSLKIVKKSENASTFETPINATVSLESNSSNALFIDKVKTMTVKLYRKDASSNLEQIGETVNLTNDQIKTLLYNKDFIITNKFFGIEDLEALEEVATDVNNWVYANYVIEFSDAYNTPIMQIDETSTKIEIENGQVEVGISPSFLLRYYAQNRETPSLDVETILYANVPDNTKYARTTVAGYRLNVGAYVDQIKDILRQYYGVTGEENNWDYIYYIFGIDGNILYASSRTKNQSHDFYLEDEDILNFDRGSSYHFGFQIATNDGVYPDEIIKELDEEENIVWYNPTRENPIIELATYNTTADSITFIYKITKDLDDAFYGNTLFIQKNGTQVSEAEISKSDEYQFMTFDNLSNASTYSLMYRQKNEKYGSNQQFLSISKGNFYFDGFYTLMSDYTLSYDDTGNRLAVIIENDDMLERGIAYSVKLNGPGKTKEYVFTKGDLTSCREEFKNCLIINYADIEEFQGTNATVNVSGYYDTGIMGIAAEGNYYVLKDDSNISFLRISPTGRAYDNSIYPDGLYSYSYILESGKYMATVKNLLANYNWTQNNTPKTYELSFRTGPGGAAFGNTYSYNPKVVEPVALTTEDNNFYFSSIIPMVKTSYERKIDEIKIKANLYGLTQTIVNNEFASNDKKVYVELYENSDFTGLVDTKNANLDLGDLSTLLTFNFTGLKPDKTYYYRVFANILNSTNNYAKTEIYDYTDTGILERREKSAKTLGAVDILSSVDSYYQTTTTNEKYANRKVTINTNFANIENFRLNYLVTDGEGRGVLDTKNIAVGEFNSNLVLDYDITDSDFKFGHAGYNLKITAYTAQNDELVLYNDEFVPHLNNSEYITELREPIFNVSNLETSVQDGKYVISFNINAQDLDKVLENAEYTVKVFSLNDNNERNPEIIERNHGSSPVVLNNHTGTQNVKLYYEGLDANAYYYIEVTGSIYRNNASLDNPVSTVTNVFSKKTGNRYNLSLGTATLAAANNIITLNYRNASTLDNLTKVIATINKDGAIGQTVTLTGNNLLNALAYNSESKTWSLTLDLTNSGVSYNTNDRIILTVRYFAKDIETQVESEVNTIDYANFSE